MECYLWIHSRLEEIRQGRGGRRRARMRRAMWFSWSEILTATRIPDKSILSCRWAVDVAAQTTRCIAGLHISAALCANRLQENQRVTRLELATSSLARRCSTTELHPQF